MQRRKIIEIAVKTIFWGIILNVGMTCTIDRFNHSQLTETQLLLRVPQTFFWNFNLGANER